MLSLVLTRGLEGGPVIVPSYGRGLRGSDKHIMAFAQGLLVRTRQGRDSNLSPSIPLTMLSASRYAASRNFSAGRDFLQETVSFIHSLNSLLFALTLALAYLT